MNETTQSPPPLPDAVRAYLAEIGRRGGTKSRHTLTRTQARAMVAAREAKRRARLEAEKTV